MIWRNLFSKVVLKTTEYDFYTFEIDFKSLFREKKNLKEFIIYNLEKQHPRFLSQCKWEYFFSFKNKKLMVNVIVVDQIYFSKLIEEGKCNFYIEKPKRKIFPIMKKGFVAILVISFCLIFGCAFSLIEPSSQKTREEKPKSLIETEEKTENQKAEKVLSLDDVFRNLITNFTNEKIFFSSLSLENFPNQKKIGFSITGVYSEDIENFFQTYILSAKLNDFNVDKIGIKINSTKYETENLEVVPIIQGEIFQLQEKSKENLGFTTREIQKECLINFRNYLIKNKIVPLEENLEKGVLVFQVKKTEVEKIFLSYFLEKTLILTSCKITSNIQEDFIRFDFDFFQQEDEDVFFINNCFTEDLFSILEKFVEKKADTENVEIGKNDYVKPESTSFYEGKIIGKVRNALGEESLLIKNPEGKIILK